MNMVWGVIPIFLEKVSTEDLEDHVIGTIRTGETEGYLKKDDHVFVVSRSVIVGDSGMFAGVYEVSNLLR